MTEHVAIVLPPINPKLHANNTGHWRSKAAAVKQLRQLAQIVARPFVIETWDRAILHYAFFVPDNRRRDEANMIQSQKPAVDGVVKSGLIADDSWQYLSTGRVTVEIDRGNPRVVLTFERVTK